MELFRIFSRHNMLSRQGATRTWEKACLGSSSKKIPKPKEGKGALRRSREKAANPGSSIRSRSEPVEGEARRPGWKEREDRCAQERESFDAGNGASYGQRTRNRLRTQPGRRKCPP